MKTLFTEEERTALDEARTKKYVPPDPTKFRLVFSTRSGKQMKDREYKTFQAAENALKKAIKRDLNRPDLYRAQIWPPGEPKYGDETEYHTDYRPKPDSVWYKTAPGQHSVMFKVFS